MFSLLLFLFICSAVQNGSRASSELENRRDRSGYSSGGGETSRRNNSSSCCLCCGRDWDSAESSSFRSNCIVHSESRTGMFCAFVRGDEYDDDKNRSRIRSRTWWNIIRIYNVKTNLGIGRSSWLTSWVCESEWVSARAETKKEGAWLGNLVSLQYLNSWATRRRRSEIHCSVVVCSAVPLSMRDNQSHSESSLLRFSRCSCCEVEEVQWTVAASAEKKAAKPVPSEFE